MGYSFQILQICGRILSSTTKSPVWNTLGSASLKLVSAFVLLRRNPRTYNQVVIHPVDSRPPDNQLFYISSHFYVSDLSHPTQLSTKMDSPNKVQTELSIHEAATILQIPACDLASGRRSTRHTKKPDFFVIQPVPSTHQNANETRADPKKAADASIMQESAQAVLPKPSNVDEGNTKSREFKHHAPSEASPPKDSNTTTRADHFIAPKSNKKMSARKRSRPSNLTETLSVIAPDSRAGPAAESPQVSDIDEGLLVSPAKRSRQLSKNEAQIQAAGEVVEEHNVEDEGSQTHSVATLGETAKSSPEEELTKLVTEAQAIGRIDGRYSIDSVHTLDGRFYVPEKCYR